jgi:hypothetical protein
MKIEIAYFCCFFQLREPIYLWAEGENTRMHLFWGMYLFLPRSSGVGTHAQITWSRWNLLPNKKSQALSMSTLRKNGEKSNQRTFGGWFTLTANWNLFYCCTYTRGLGAIFRNFWWKFRMKQNKNKIWYQYRTLFTLLTLWLKVEVYHSLEQSWEQEQQHVAPCSTQEWVALLLFT